MASRLIYQDKGHRYSLDGEYVPSVTTVVGVMDKPQLVPSAAKETALWALNNRDLVDQVGTDVWLKMASGAYRDTWNAKAKRGTGLHAHAEQLLTTGYTDAPADQLPLVYSAADFLDRWDVQPVFTEAAIYHEDRRYAGRLDLIAELAGGETWLLDFKTGSGVYPEHVLQGAGYRYASHVVQETEDGPVDVPMPEVDHVGIVHVRPGTEDHGDWDLHPVQADEFAWDTFLGLLHAHPWAQRAARKDHGLVNAPMPYPTQPEAGNA